MEMVDYSFPSTSPHCPLTRSLSLTAAAGRLPAGASQEVRKGLALAVHEHFGWQPRIKRADAAVELLVAFHKSGLAPSPIPTSKP